MKNRLLFICILLIGVSVHVDSQVFTRKIKAVSVNFGSGWSRQSPCFVDVVFNTDHQTITLNAEIKAVFTVICSKETVGKHAAILRGILRDNTHREIKFEIITYRDNSGDLIMDYGDVQVKYKVYPKI